MRALTGAPYSGRLRLEGGGVRGYGTAIWRDKEGRVRTVPMFSRIPFGLGEESFGVVEIQDPVAGYKYILDSMNHVAHRLRLQVTVMPFRPDQAPGANMRTGTSTDQSGRSTTNESLGTKEIFGVQAFGLRNTQVSPVGTQNNNDQPITRINERWTDPNTGVMILLKNTGPNGESVNSMPDYKAGDPDPALLQVPAGYKLVDETGAFSFVIPMPSARSQ